MPRAGSKQALIVEMLSKDTGATLDALIAATGWLPHTTRAALAGLRKRGYLVERIRDETKGSLYRITREALTNVFRHARARRVSVLLERRADHVSLIVEDDGKGFDEAATLGASATQGKLGLLGMQERAILAGGTVVVESKPGAGTTVFARLPLALEPAAQSLAVAAGAAEDKS